VLWEGLWFLSGFCFDRVVNCVGSRWMWFDGVSDWFGDDGLLE
jgi:hypothetical protein